MATDSNILVLGLGSSGVAVARYCANRMPSRFASVTAVDAADTPSLRATAEQLERLGVEVMLGITDPAGEYDTCVASPGIPPHAPVMVAARSRARRTVSEIQFAFEESSSPWIAVTGTNGKTTTTALTAHLLACAGLSARAVGNIGDPATDAVADQDAGQVLVAEVSSFQLALTTTFHPRVSVLLNITPDHVDWHGSLEGYTNDKLKVFANLGPDDIAVIDVDDPGSAPYADVVESQGTEVVRVSRTRSHDGGATAAGGVLALLTAKGRIELCGQDELLIKGPHNVSNALAASSAAHAIGAKPADIRKGLTTFRPIEHRLEPVGTVAGVEWFNDSKATNPDAVSKALAAFGDRPIVLLLGGRNKGNEFGPLALEAAERAKAVVLFGEACEELARAFAASAVKTYRSGTLAEAVERAASISSPGDAVVLSPACASFDEFANYEERGRSFKRLVTLLTEGESQR